MSQILATASPLGRHFTLKSLLRFAAPSIGMMIIISLYTVTDGIFIGRYAGSNALAASNIVYPAINLVLGLAIMLASGGSALVAKNLGEGEPEAARRRFTMLTIATAVFSGVLALLAFAAGDSLLFLLGSSAELLNDCRSYLYALLPFFPFAALMILFNAFFIADGRPSQGFIVSVLAGLTNAGLDYLFLAHLDFGVMGAGLATGLADVLAAAIGLIYFQRYSRILHFARPRMEWSALGQAMYNGSSELVTQLSVGITTFLFNILTFRYAGADGVAAISVILYAEMLLTAVYMGFTNGVAPIFSYRFGARDFKELRRLVRLSLTIIAGGALLSFSLSHLLAEPLVSLFLPQGGHVYELTRQGFALFSFTFLLCGFNLFVSGFFTAISDGRTSALMSFARNLLGIVFFLLTLPRMFGLSGVWLAVPAADVTALLFGIILLISRMREFKDMDAAQKEIRLTDINGRNA
ncbi:MATE family efflux transporter [Mitsuokella sp. AF33-22]|uniref:MATE family efflux transporter n=1 Tax=Mitsuokella sp. AF33-22 TaxID=2292047 RepID=UPI000E4D80B6|nr:MATE family efflux transporter [Mitsuokella sp. AF33-22]RHM54611.1 MATE family efflux transporter [Mitsuokella sp. AF33-22]